MTEQNRKTNPEGPREQRVAIARGFAGRPTKVRVLDERDGVTVVTGSEENRAIGYPSTDVFKFDDALYGELREAFSSGDQARLDRAWRRGIFEKLLDT
jgi:hypothetical protein